MIMYSGLTVFFLANESEKYRKVPTTLPSASKTLRCENFLSFLESIEVMPILEFGNI